MSDRINGTEANPWTPIKREPLGDGGAKPKKAAEPKGVGITLTLALPPELEKAITSLAATQKAMADRLEYHAEESQAVLKELERAAASHKSMVVQASRQADAMLGLLQQVAELARTLEKASTAPRKVTLRRNAEGVAVDAVSTIQKGAH